MLFLSNLKLAKRNLFWRHTMHQFETWVILYQASLDEDSDDEFVPVSRAGGRAKTRV